MVRAGAVAAFAALVAVPAEAFLPLQMLEEPLLAGLLAAAPPTLSATAGPFVAASWTANFVQTGVSGTNAEGRIAYDREHKRIRQTSVSHAAVFSKDDKTYSDVLSVNGATNYTLGTYPNDVCKVLSSPFADPFALLAITTPNGTSSVEGQPCDLWAAKVPTPGKNSSTIISACISAKGEPLALNLTSAVGSFADVATDTVYSNFSLGPLADAVFERTDACLRRYPAAPCPDSGVAALAGYRIHGAEEPLALDNRNVGDALGDMAFVCVAGAIETYKNKVVSLWEFQANTSFTQYSYCLFQGGKNVCLGSPGKQVGRQSAMGLGKGAVQGQCTENLDVGTWFSLPGDGQCAEGQPVGTDGCTWGQAVRKRSVMASCILQDRGLADMCKQEITHAPLSRSAAIFHAALASSDPAQGGCPDAPLASVPEEVPIVV